MAKVKKDSEYVCKVCGTTLLVTECGVGILNDIVCCEKKMDTRKIKPKKKAKAAAAKGKKAQKKPKKR